MQRRIVCFTLLSLFLPPLGADTLWDIYQLARKNDPEYLSVVAANQASKEDIDIANAEFWPRIDLSASNNRSETGALTTTSNSYSARISMPLYDYSKYVASDRAETVSLQSGTDLKNAEVSLMIKVANRYFDVLSARDNVDFSQAEQQAIARQLDQTKQRFDVGLVAITDVHEAQARYDLALAQGIKAENELGNALEALREITSGIHSADYILGDDAPMLRPNPSDIEEWTQLALKNNAELHSKEQAVALAQLDLKATRASYYPNIYASISHSKNDSESDTTAVVPAITGTAAEASTDSTSGSVSLNYNFYDGGSSRAKKRRAEAFLIQTQENLEQTRRAIQRQARNAYLNVTAGISRINALKQAVVSRQSAQKAAEAGFEVGTKTTVDVLDSRRELFSALNEYSQSRYDFLLNSLRLKQAAGTLVEADINQISQWLVAADAGNPAANSAAPAPKAAPAGQGKK